MELSIVSFPNLLVMKPRRLRAGMQWANEHGLTRVHSAGGDFEHLDLYDECIGKGSRRCAFLHFVFF